jgi:uncharacterized protein (TIGR00369 family)
MPVAGLVNPVTGLATLAPLAVLVDHVGGLQNHHRRGPREWTVSSELALELTPDAESVVAAADTPVRATSRALGIKESTAVSECQLVVGDAVIGSGSVRSFFVQAPAQYSESPLHEGSMDARHGLAAMMSAGQARVEADVVVLPQCPDPVLDNSLGVIHGGIASTGLEVVGAAAINQGRAADPLTTASLRVNFLRPFFAGDQSRYVGTASRIGRRSGVADAQAIGSDGRPAILARVTSYRR